MQVTVAAQVGSVAIRLRLIELVEEHDRVDSEEERHEHGQTRQVSLDDVLAALGGRRETEAAEAGVAARMHEHEADEGGGEQNLDDCEEPEHESQASRSS
jgi:hypothetical protein